MRCISPLSKCGKIWFTQTSDGIELILLIENKNYYYMVNYKLILKTIQKRVFKLTKIPAFNAGAVNKLL